MRVRIFNFHPSMQQGTSLKQRLIKGTVGSFGLKIVSTGMAFLLNLLLAQMLGSEGLGTYALVITWIGLLGLPAKLGFPQLLVRDISIYYAQENWGLLKGLIHRTYQISTIISIVLAVSVACGVWLVGKESPILITLTIALIALPLSTLRKLNQSVLSGLNKIVRGQMAESLAAPFLMLALTLCIYTVFGDIASPALLIAFYVGVTGITVLIGTYQLSCALPKQVFSIVPEYTTWRWVRTAIPFMALGALYMVQSQTDIVMLGAMKGTQSVGLYVVANRVASSIIFILMASNAALSPSIASLYAEGKTVQLEKIIIKSSRAIFVISSAVAVTICLFRGYILGLFGNEFVGNGEIIIILIVGQLVNAFVGPADVLLNMSGNEGLCLKIFALGAIANIVLNFMLIPIYGITGAAIATAFSMALCNLISMVFAIKRLGINPTAFGTLKS